MLLNSKYTAVAIYRILRFAKMFTALISNKSIAKRIELAVGNQESAAIALNLIHHKHVLITDVLGGTRALDIATQIQIDSTLEASLMQRKL